MLRGPFFYDLRDRDVVDARFFAFIKNLFIRDKEEEFDSKVDNMPLTVNTVIDKIVIGSEILS